MIAFMKSKGKHKNKPVNHLQNQMKQNIIIFYINQLARLIQLSTDVLPSRIAINSFITAIAKTHLVFHPLSYYTSQVLKDP